MAMYLGSEKVSGNFFTQLEGTTLWEGHTLTDFDLLDDAENYEYLEFYCGKGNGCPCCIRVPKALYGEYSLRTIFKDNDNLTQCIARVIKITGKRVTTLKYTVVNWTNNSSQTYNSNELSIFKVIGYKKEQIGVTEKEVRLIERSTNSAGTYLKYSDGTLICMGNPSGTSNNSDWWSFCNRTDEGIQVNFPHAFIEPPASVVCTPANYYGLFSIMLTEINKDNFKFTGLRAKNNSGTGWSFRYQAVGRWK